MRADEHLRELVTSGVEARGTFGISFRNQAHIMEILRDTLYQDPITAVLREIGTNARDAHWMPGVDEAKRTLPIKVTLPTPLEPVLIIRDFGPGMTDEDIFNVFTQYGESTKRESNDLTGMLGIGSKSPFALSDTFTVTSWNGGWKRVYVATLDESNVGEMNRFHQEPCAEDETGLEVSVPVRPNDIDAFHRKAKRVFQFFRPPVEINTTMPTEDRAGENEHGYFDSELPHWVALMGCIPYRINMDQIQAELRAAQVPIQALSRTSGVVFFDLGALLMSASREDLKYTDKTKKALVAKLGAFLETYTEAAVASFLNPEVTDWEKRQKAKFLNEKMGIRAPLAYSQLGTHEVRLFETHPRTFTFHQGFNRAAAIISTDEKTVIYVQKDRDRYITGYTSLRYGWGYIVQPRSGFTDEEVREELDACLAAAHMTGVPVKPLEDVPWARPNVVPATNYPREANKKHQVSCFKARMEGSFGDVLSEHWEIQPPREPQDTDIYVILDRFQSTPETSFLKFSFATSWGLLVEISRTFQVALPPIYGYKTTMTKPVLVGDRKGRTFQQWLPSFVADILSQPSPLRDKLNGYRWRMLLRQDFSIYVNQTTRESLDRTLIVLGAEHPVVVFLRSCMEGLQLTQARGLTDSNFEALLQILKATNVQLEADLHLQKVIQKYRMLRVRGIKDFLEGSRHLEDWIDYIQLVDRDSAHLEASKAPELSSDVTVDSEEKENTHGEVHTDE